MPTENRSSNTELSKIVTEALVGMVSGVTGMKPPADEPLPGFIQAPIDRAVTRISDLLAQPAPQPHPEPIAWMVGTAIWWTKEEAERDAAATGKTITPIGPMSGIAPAEEHQGEPAALPERKAITAHGLTALDSEAEGWNACLDEIAKLGPLYTHADPGEVERVESLLRASRTSLDNCALQIENLQAQLANKQTMSDNYCALLMDANQKLAERDALLREASYSLKRERWVDADGALCKKIDAALSASAEPSAPKCGKCAGSALVQYPEHAGAWSDCPDCKLSAPVEIDERAAFEKAMGKRLQAPTDSTLFKRDRDLPNLYDDDYISWAWDGWRERAALERKS